MKMNTKGRIVLFSIMTIILLQFVSIYDIQITHAASSCCGVGACAATGTGATGNGASAGSGFSAGMSFKSNEVELVRAQNQYKETFENGVDRFELLQMSSANINIFNGNPIFWVIM
jgi:hypothetical protein